jgi:hypothetical protein
MSASAINPNNYALYEIENTSVVKYGEKGALRFLSYNQGRFYNLQVQALSRESVGARVQVISATIECYLSIGEVVDSYLQVDELEMRGVPRHIMVEIMSKFPPLTDFTLKLSTITFINPPRNYHLDILPLDPKNSSLVCEYKNKFKRTHSSLHIHPELKQLLYTETDLAVKRLFFSSRNKAEVDIDVIDLVYKAPARPA